jgi:thiol-disulfide isomerase/thioredoxin
LPRNRLTAVLVAAVVVAGLGAAWFGVRMLRHDRGAPTPPRNDAAIPDGTLREISSGESVTTEVNAKAPAFAALSLDDDQPLRSIDFVGDKVVLLEFWSVFCTSCIQEMPFMAELDRKWKDKGLEVIGVNTDFFGPERVRRFMARLEPKPAYRMIADRNQRIAKAFNVEAIPVTVLIDSAGWIRLYHLGWQPDDRKVIEKEVAKWVGRIRETQETVAASGGKTPVAAGGAAAVKVEDPLPDAAIRTTGGERLSLAGYRAGKPMALFFWSLFCQPCREEMPIIDEAAARLGPDDGRILSVNVDAPRLVPAVKRFLDKESFRFTTVLDSQSEPAGGIAAALGIAYSPTVVFVGADGRVEKLMVGEIGKEELRSSLASFLGAEPG